MAQHDYAIANQGFPAFRSDLNDALAAIVSNNSGATEPTTMFAHQMWVDTAANPSVLKIRNADNDAWITIGSIDQTGDTFTLTSAVSATTLNTSGAVVFNDAGANVDFRVEGDTDANLLFVDAGNDRVGIGTSSPATKLNLGGSSDQTLQINGSDTAAFVGTSTSVAQISSNRNPTTGAIFDSGRAVSYINLEASNVNGNIQFYTTATNNVNATERMRIDSAGNVGIGTTSPSVASGTGIVINGGGGQARLALKNSNTGDAAGDGFQIGVSDDSSAFIEQRENSHLFFSTNATERMRIDSSGNLLVGTTTSSANAGGLSLFNGSDAGRIDFSNVSGAARFHARFYFGAGATVVGSISSNSTSTSYITSSDYRLKHDIQPMTGALAKVAQLKPVTYKWNADDSDGEGFIAHELAEVAPYAVTGEKDGEEMQGVDYGKITPLLTAALQEAIAEIQSLKARVAELEAK